MKGKLALVFYPLLLSSIGFTVIYTLIHWLLFIKTGVNIPKSIAGNILPLILSVIIVYLLIRPGVLLLQFPFGRTSVRRWQYQGLALLTIAVPAIMAQSCLIKYTQPITQLETIAQINPAKATAYYQIQHFYVGKKQLQVVFSAETGGKFRSELTFNAWAAMPVFENSADTANEECSYWMAMKHSKTIVNILGKRGLIDAQRKFEEESFQKFAATDFRKVRFWEHETNPHHVAYFESAIRKSPIVRYKDAVLMIPHFEPAAQRGYSNLFGVFIIWGVAAIVFFVLLQVPTLPDEPEYKTY